MNAPFKPPTATPLAAWTDFTPSGPWTDGTVVVRNLDGVGFTYSASLNALIVNPNISYIAKNANNFIVQNLPAPTNGGDAANKTYVDGHAGAAGPPGPQGPAGPVGPAGTPGNTVLYGSGPPAAATGVNGNFYIDTTANFIYGPKAAGVWPAGTSLIGPQGPIGNTGPQGPIGNTGSQGPIGNTGPQGPIGNTGPQGPIGNTGSQGPIGPTGVAGNTVLYGTVDPTAGVGVDGNFYINTTSHFMFGPKASGAWPTGTSLIGPQGPIGTTGATGSQGPIGNTGPQGPQGVPGTGQPSTTLPLMDGVAAIGTATAYYALADHVHPSDTTKAPINNPVFTGTTDGVVLDMGTF
jgi:hypothetical protein